MSFDARMLPVKDAWKRLVQCSERVELGGIFKYFPLVWPAKTGAPAS